MARDLETEHLSGPGGPVRSDRPLRILHVTRTPVGGIFRHIADLAAEQTEAGHQVGVVFDSLTCGPFEAARLAELDTRLGLGVLTVPMPRRPTLGDIATFTHLYRRFKALRPDVIHGHGAKGGAFGRVIGTLLSRGSHRVLRVYCPHGGTLHYDPASRQGRLYFMLERWLEALTDRLVFVSRYEEERYRQVVGRPRPPSRVVLNGLRPDEFVPVRADAGARDFLFVGMMRDLKGADVFIDAMELLRARHPHVTAAMVGSGVDLDRYKRTVQERGLGEVIRFHDPMPIREAFALARALVVPSRAESMPYVVLEASAAGMKLIATSVGGIPEILSRETERLVSPGDADALARAMADMLADPRRACRDAEQRRDHVAQRFTVAGMARDMEALYRDGLADRGAAPAADDREIAGQQADV